MKSFSVIQKLILGVIFIVLIAYFFVFTLTRNKQYRLLEKSFIERVHAENKFVNNLEFTYAGDAFQLRYGSSQKIVFKDQFGDKWIFKIISAQRIMNSITAYRLNSFFDIDVPMIFEKELIINSIPYRGIMCSFLNGYKSGEVLLGLAGDVKFSKEAIGDILCREVLDYLLCNRDFNTSNFLVNIKENYVNEVVEVDFDASFFSCDIMSFAEHIAGVLCVGIKDLYDTSGINRQWKSDGDKTFRSFYYYFFNNCELSDVMNSFNTVSLFVETIGCLPKRVIRSILFNPNGCDRIIRRTSILKKEMTLHYEKVGLSKRKSVTTISFLKKNISDYISALIKKHYNRKELFNDRSKSLLNSSFKQKKINIVFSPQAWRMMFSWKRIKSRLYELKNITINQFEQQAIDKYIERLELFEAKIPELLNPDAVIHGMDS